MPHIYKLSCHVFFLVIFALLLSSCGTSEEVQVVEDDPRPSTAGTTAEADTSAEFMEISIGLIDPVDTFDPLFANNLSTMRVLSLIYDGLYSLDKDGSVTPAIASDVTVSDDSLTYTFSLNTDLFYHDNTAFMSGVGRRLQASDIKWAFERTARGNVPPEASKLLMNISGYEEFFVDQRNIYDSERRAIEGVLGIEVVNPATIRFNLNKPDPEFIRKLASPYLFIYPREAVQSQDKSLKTNPIGTGAYKLDSRDEMSVVLVKDNSDRSEDRITNPKLNRIEFVYNPEESELFQEFARNNLQWIPEIGPETKRIAISDEGLTAGYAENYMLTSTGTRHINIFFNQTQSVNMNWLYNHLADVEPDSIDMPDHISIRQSPPAVDQDEIGDPDPVYLVTFSNDYFVRVLLTKIQEQYLEPYTEFNLSEIRTPVSRTALYTSRSDSFHRALYPEELQPWLQYSSSVNGLHHNEVQGIESHDVPWKLFVEQVRTDETSGGAR